jgi:hypothetical protein
MRNDEHGADAACCKPHAASPWIPHAAVLLLATLVAFAPFLYDTALHGASRWGIHDWAQFYAWYDLPRTSLLRYGELAFWNPYVCGGLPGFAHTHDAALSPVFLLILVFGPVTGMRLLMVVLVYLAMLSMFALVRSLGVGRLGGYLAAVVWGLNGNLVLQFWAGHSQHLFVGLLPLAVWLFLREGHQWRGPLLAGLLLGLLVLSGAIYPPMYAALLLGALALVLTVLDRSPRWLGRLVVVGVSSTLLAAVKLVCTIPFLGRIVEAKPDTSGTGLGFLWQRLVSPQPSWTVQRMGNYTLGYWEFGAYVGVPAVVLAALGMLILVKRFVRSKIQNPKSRIAAPVVHTWALLLVGLAFLLLSFGSLAPGNLFELLRRLPFLSSVHVPFRFVIVPLMVVVLLAGVGLDRLVRLRRRVRWPAAIVVVAVAGDLALAYQRLRPQVFAIDGIDVAAGTAVVSDPSVLPGHERQTGPLLLANVGPRGDALFEQRLVGYTGGARDLAPQDLYTLEPQAAARYLLQLQGRGDLAGYEMLRLPSTVLAVGQPGYRGEVYLDGGHGAARLVDFTPSRFTVDVTADVEEAVVLNQNFYPGWRVTVNGEPKAVTDLRALVAARVPAGAHRIVFWYRPDGFRAGLAISIGSLCAAVGYLVFVGRRPARKSTFSTQQTTNNAER